MNAYIVLSNGTEREIHDVTGIAISVDKLIVRSIDYNIPYDTNDIIRIEIMNNDKRD